MWVFHVSNLTSCETDGASDILPDISHSSSSNQHVYDLYSRLVYDHCFASEQCFCQGLMLR